nr:serine--tRNA ligase [bacterium]
RLQRALITFMLDVHIETHGYHEIYPPYMVRSECMFGAGQLPKFGDNLYRDAEDDFMWIPTAEVPVTNMHAGEILEHDQLPLKYVAFSACFRREKMSAGRDVRGIKRGHQFDKIELVTFARPEKSYHQLEQLLSHAENICARLGLPYRVLDICTADLSFTAAKKYDIELWAPGCNEWLEVSSCSNFESFQARRANIRYRPEPKAKPEFVHTLNGSGLALPRTLIAILENYQDADGGVVLPDVLVPYMNGIRRIAPE